MQIKTTLCSQGAVCLRLGTGSARHGQCMHSPSWLRDTARAHEPAPPSAVFWAAMPLTPQLLCHGLSACHHTPGGAPLIETCPGILSFGQRPGHTGQRHGRSGSARPNSVCPSLCRSKGGVAAEPVPGAGLGTPGRSAARRDDAGSGRKGRVAGGRKRRAGRWARGGGERRGHGGGGGPRLPPGGLRGPLPGRAAAGVLPGAVPRQGRRRCRRCQGEDTGARGARGAARRALSGGSAQVERIERRCLELFGRDYRYSVIPNVHGEVCAHYPRHIVFLERDAGASRDS